MFCTRKYNENFIKIVSVLYVVLNSMCAEIWSTKEPNLIYILMWSGVNEYFKLNRNSLILLNCEHQNCHFVNDIKFLPSLLDFDVILFHAVNLHGAMDLPEVRSQTQLYVLVGIEPSAVNPIQSDKFNYFFNYTWTYKLNSDIPFPYFVVRNKSGQIVAPKRHVNWILPRNMEPPDKKLVKKLQTKSITAAWFVSNCDAHSPRLKYIRQLRTELNLLGHQIDIYGNCDANKACPKDDMDNCYKYVENQYYFYLSFENSFCEDYVTEKVMTAVDHYAVPVVYGGANYSRFLPDGTYLNAREYTPAELAQQMVDLTEDLRTYYNFFRFHKYYTYHAVDQSVDSDAVCAFCNFINRDSIKNVRRTYAKLTKWWNR